MRETESLVTLARKYCIDNINHWETRYKNERSGQEIPYSYSSNDYDLFPRCNVLRAIFDNVGFLVESGISATECKSKLVVIGQTAGTFDELQNEVSIKAIQDERDKFTTFINAISPDDIANVEPLFHARRLSQSEVENIEKKLHEIYDYDGHWIPIGTQSPAKAVWVHHTDLTPTEVEGLLSVIREKAKKRQFEIKEDGINYEIEIESMDITGYETTYCDDTYEWILYSSHENTVAFGGTWLISEVEKIFSVKNEKLHYYNSFSE